MESIICNESGQSMVEYGLILALIAIVAVAGISVFGGGVKGLFDRSMEQMPW
ncbi:MAG: Flp family type IVb pilin [Lachnospiraceae bacterium]|nr:Flp family type IVb pilin [Lachnospiraceae bacterium]